MTIRRGEEWGVPVDRPDDLALVSNDHELASIVGSNGRSRALTAGGGDLHRSLGSPGVRPTMLRVPIDLMHVTADGTEHVAVAHVVARRGWWRGPIVAAMNVDHLGEWNVAPRAHPNDGRFDVVEVAASMGLRARWQAYRRLPQGTHVPHPQIDARTATSADWEFRRPMALWLDGERLGEVRRLRVDLEPDAFELHV